MQLKTYKNIEALIGKYSEQLAKNGANAYHPREMRVDEPGARHELML